jgi:hypothetical protein
MVLAMTLHALHLPQEAHKTWEKGLYTIKTNPEDFGPGNVARHGWIDWLIARALVNEAREQLGLAQEPDKSAFFTP